jgi:hypothetical protein
MKRHCSAAEAAPTPAEITMTRDRQAASFILALDSVDPYQMIVA